MATYQTCRDAVLLAAWSLTGGTTDRTFGVDDVVAWVGSRCPSFKASTVRTHVTSRMCRNAPDHHGTTYDDLERVARGEYRLTDEGRSVALRLI